jgi:hypothetical protein
MKAIDHPALAGWTSRILIFPLFHWSISSPPFDIVTAFGNLSFNLSGAIYDEDGGAHILHSEKVDALAELVEENSSENFLVAYNFKSDLERLKERFPKAVTISKGGEEIDQWNNGHIRMLLVHP